MIVFFYICILSRTSIENDVKQKLEYNCKLDKIGDLKKFEGYLDCWWKTRYKTIAKKTLFLHLDHRIRSF